MRIVCVIGVLLAGSAPARAAQPLCDAPPSLRVDAGSAEDYGRLGNWFAEHGNGVCAVSAFQRGLKVNPNSAPLHFSLGSALHSVGRIQAAREELRQAISLDPRLAQPHIALGVLLHDSGDLNGALQQWQVALQLDPASTLTLDWLAKARIESGQYTAALDLLRGAPDTEDLAIDRTLANARASLTERAIADGTQELSMHPGWDRLRAALATILVQRSRYEEALALLRPALKADPTLIDLQVLYLRVLVLTDKKEEALPYAHHELHNHPDQFDFLYLTGLLEREDADYAPALEHLQRATQLEPNHFDARLNLGIVLAKLHRPDEAEVQLRKAKDLPDATPEVHFQLAGVLRQLGKVQEATAETRIYEEALAKRSQHDELVSLAAQAAQKLQSGDAASAAKLDRDLLAKEPKDAVHWYNLALALDRLGDDQGKTQALEQAVELKPQFALAWNELGYMEMRSGKKNEAEVAFRHAATAAPQYAEAESNLGSLLADEGRSTEAEEHFRAALSANPRYVDAWINLAALLAERSRFGDAKQAVESALKVDPQSTAANQLLHMLPQDPRPEVRR